MQQKNIEKKTLRLLRLLVIYFSWFNAFKLETTAVNFTESKLKIFFEEYF